MRCKARLSRSDLVQPLKILSVVKIKKYHSNIIVDRIELNEVAAVHQSSMGI